MTTLNPTSLTISANQLRAFIERIERLEEEKVNVTSDIKDVYAEAKANGFDTKTIRQIVRVRKMDQDDVQEQEALFDLYMNALQGGSREPSQASA